MMNSDHRAVSFHGDPINPSPQARSLKQILFGLGRVKTNVIYVLLSAPEWFTSGQSTSTYMTSGQAAATGRC